MMCFFYNSIGHITCWKHDISYNVSKKENNNYCKSMKEGTKMNIYDISVKKTNQEEVSLSKYEGKVLLVVNTATGCGFTPQYEGLQALYSTYKDQGFEILDFPSNQFLNQAPGTDEELAQFCQINYNTSFETFAKIDVNGSNAHPLYQYLKANSDIEAMDEGLSAFAKRLEKHNITWQGDDIKWNFTKFLIGKDGKVLERIAPTVAPSELASKIEAALQK